MRVDGRRRSASSCRRGCRPAARAARHPRQRARYLKPLAAGRAIGAMAVTEPAAGSDFASLPCRAEPVRGGFIVSGEKTYITNAAAADFLIVAARLGDDRTSDLTLLLVPRKTDGVRVRRLSSLGLATTAMGHITFRRCRVSARRAARRSGRGYTLHPGRAESRTAVRRASARSPGRITRSKRRARILRDPPRVRPRAEPFPGGAPSVGGPGDGARGGAPAQLRGVVAWTAGEDATRRSRWSSCSAIVRRSARSKCACSCTAGSGIMADHWTSRWYRDARALTIAAGTPEVMRELIAAYLRL